MKLYQTALKKHLAEYAVRRLGIHESGIYQGRPYQHILPWKLRFLNLLESIRAEVVGYLRGHPTVQLHRYFHHLNSSQALAFNLFYPYLAAGLDMASVLTEALGVGGDAREWQFEFVPEEKEGTNVDVAWQKSQGQWVFCEVKLSELGFGTATNDSRHQRKLVSIYRPRLEGLVANRFLENRQFFRHYQVLRNLSLLKTHADSQVIFLLPEENEVLCSGLEEVLRNLTRPARSCVHVAHLEKVLADLAGRARLASDYRNYAGRLQEKYDVNGGRGPFV